MNTLKYLSSIIPFWKRLTEQNCESNFVKHFLIRLEA